jgi:type I site-specific restriction endonuclease
MTRQRTNRNLWPKVKLAEVAEQCLGKMLDAKKNKGRLMPYLPNPITLQREFARRVTAVQALKTAHRTSLADLDALFSIAIHKLRTNKPLTKLDLKELERMLAESGVASLPDLEKAKKESAGLGLFIPSLVGLDREAAKKVLGEFMHHKKLGAQQIEFINLIVDHLTEQGVMDAALLYESPFIDANPLGVAGVFDAGEVTQIIEAPELVRLRAVA